MFKVTVIPRLSFNSARMARNAPFDSRLFNMCKRLSCVDHLPFVIPQSILDACVKIEKSEMEVLLNFRSLVERSVLTFFNNLTPKNRNI